VAFEEQPPIVLTVPAHVDTAGREDLRLRERFDAVRVLRGRSVGIRADGKET
jgi:hypothetical protein